MQIQSRENCHIQASLTDVMVVQPILGGDPTLAEKLAGNIQLYPNVSFLWLIDQDDSLGMDAAKEAVRNSGGDNVQIMRPPRSPRENNPKIFKLNWAYATFKDTFIILDDDCWLHPGSLERLVACLAYGDLATGIPFYQEKGNFWSKLLANFPNGQSILTYFPTAPQGKGRTINGMFYATKKSALNRIGGFTKISRYLCDDYELAKCFTRESLSLCQSTAHVSIFTALPNAKSYLQLMHRWSFFSARQISELLSPQAIWFVVAPTTLPLLLMITAIYLQPALIPLVFSLYLAKAEMTFRVRRKFFGVKARGRFDLEIVTDLIIPLFFVVAIFSRKIRWRDKVFASDGKTLSWHT